MAERSLSKQLRYAAAGLLLALGAPLGLFLVRVLAGRADPSRPVEDWARDPATYAYVALSTAVAFTAFGAALGRKADRLLRLAGEDVLTGLLNRRAMEERLEQECERTARYGEPLSVLLLDVDELKGINEAHGHAGGDEALRRVAAVVHGACRATDVAGRWGGDEFLILAPSTETDPAASLAERVREGVSMLSGRIPIRISVGVASCRGPGRGPSTATLVARADRALYRAKKRGRNCVAVAPAAAGGGPV
jgi:diguanylate cyclase (GGDEF)-like protein